MEEGVIVPAIRAMNLCKDFPLPKPVQGALAKVRSYFRPEFSLVKAVENVSFEVQRGERVAFIGPNSAGKSTTIKMLTGILQPTSGKVEILGMDPLTQRKKVATKVGAIFGQRSQLWQHLPAQASFRLLASQYEIEASVFQSRLAELSGLFELERFADRPVKALSLGERMRCELVASLLHNPEILFLDEPTIGLDLVSKGVIRDLIHRRSILEGTTIFLTSHDMADIETVCDRIILINHGRIVVDASVGELKSIYGLRKRVTITTMEQIAWQGHPAITEVSSPVGRQFDVDLSLVSAFEAIHFIIGTNPFSDISIVDPPLEEIIAKMYKK